VHWYYQLKNAKNVRKTEKRNSTFSIYFLKVWWQDATLFDLFYDFWLYSTYIHTITFVHYSHPSPVAEVHLQFPHCLRAQWEKPPWGAEPRFELGPAIQQASALPIELRCSLIELRCSLLNFIT